MQFPNINGPTGATGPASAVPTLFFNQVAATISIYPPVNTEVTTNTLNVPVTTGQNVKIDFSISPEFVTSANWSITYIFRLYRNGVLINARTTNRSQNTSGTFRIPFSTTYVDTAVATTTNVYEERVIVTVDTNLTSATVLNRVINAIAFP